VAWFDAGAPARPPTLRRDPRLALHSGIDEPDAATGDPKVAGLVVLIDDAAKVQEYLDAATTPIARHVRPSPPANGWTGPRQAKAAKTPGEGDGIKPSLAHQPNTPRCGSPSSR
jgi:hypothetical protein